MYTITHVYTYCSLIHVHVHSHTNTEHRMPKAGCSFASGPSWALVQRAVEAGLVTADLPLPLEYLIGLAYRSSSPLNRDKRKVFITGRRALGRQPVISDLPVSRGCGIKCTFVFIYLRGSFPEKTTILVTCALCIMLIRFENSYIVFIRAITFSLIKLREK